MSQLGQNLCVQCDCRPIENRDTWLCATCGFENRRLERQDKKVKIVKPVKKVTEKRAKQNQEYAKLRKEYLEVYPVCEVVECHNKSKEIHHMAGRDGDKLTDPDNFLAVCPSCHHKITIDSAWAIEQGYSILRST